ncbi:hypothetical protein ONZ45_g7959 [Pleurotus djamor]|nr:hypothetical protein ONZ45_g7959 [Pleurotus djamor]
MSVLLPPTPPSSLRKRTSSFYCSASAAPILPSNPRPLKAAKTSATTAVTVMNASPLRRTESFLSFDNIPAPPVVTLPSKPPLPYNRTLQFEKEQCDRRRALLRVWQPKSHLSIEAELEITLSIGASLQLLFPNPPSNEPTTVKLPYVKNPSPSTLTRKPVIPEPPRAQVTESAVDSSLSDLKLAERTPIRTSPLSFAPNSRLPTRRRNKRSKTDADWHRIAVRHSMRQTPEGQKILTIGARKAVQLLSATRELERLVAMQDTCDDEMLEEAMEDELELEIDGEIEPLTSVEMEDLQRPLLPEFQDDWEMISA